MKGLNHQVAEHDIGPNYMLSSLIEITFRKEVSKIFQGVQERDWLLIVHNYRQLQHPQATFLLDRNLEGGCSFPSFLSLLRNRKVRVSLIWKHMIITHN